MNKKLIVLFVLLVPLATAQTFEFTICQDASGNDRDLFCVFPVEVRDEWPANKYGDGIRTNEGTPQRYFVRNLTTGLSTTGDLSLFAAWNVTGSTNFHYVVHGATSGDKNANPDQRKNFELAQNGLRQLIYRHEGDSGVFLCIPTEAMPLGFVTAWALREGDSVTVTWYGEGSTSDTLTCDQSANPPTRGENGQLVSGGGYAATTPGTINQATSRWNVWEFRVWKRAIDTATLDALADPTSSTGGVDELVGAEAGFYNFENATIVVVPEVDEPTEFSSGLVSFASSLGFSSPESQNLFALILVALTTVAVSVGLKLMSSGKPKNIIILSSAGLVAAFCVLLGMLQLWVLTIAVVLSMGTGAGSVALLNTYKAASDLARRAAGVPTMEMMEPENIPQAEEDPEREEVVIVGEAMEPEGSNEV